MRNSDMAQQTLLENSMLKYLVEGLRNTLAWKVQGQDVARKLSTLRFIAQSFQHHLERLMTLEECDGYMDQVLKVRPNSSKIVDALRSEHERFRTALRRILHGLQHVSSTDQARFTRICADLTHLLDEVDRHHEKEADVFQEAFEREEAGLD